ncbi:uncharacterized protein LOC117180532 [Belonocnema kinseyi]|uniref:uncharacterized protein LOC117180532 n=1 Tax=Belonocnema kinseyi TaxID=2817044 RepID=UPI00143D0793|nr:uncharacterized protein LOC117180532 [Belonocnema kinseyi]
MNIYFTRNFYTTTEEAYLVAKGAFMDELEKLSNDLASTSMNNSASKIAGLSYRSMPKIELPKFSGSYTEWENFKDFFTSLVHSNPEVSSVKKLHHLKSSLIGEATQLLHRIPIT